MTRHGPVARAGTHGKPPRWDHRNSFVSSQNGTWRPTKEGRPAFLECCSMSVINKGVTHGSIPPRGPVLAKIVDA